MANNELSEMWKETVVGHRTVLVPVGAEDNHDELDPGQQIFVLRSEPGTFLRRT
jgi:hypothetical protein